MEAAWGEADQEQVHTDCCGALLCHGVCSDPWGADIGSTQGQRSVHSKTAYYTLHIQQDTA